MSGTKKTVGNFFPRDFLFPERKDPRAKTALGEFRREKN
jgi:hypothetical protein